MEKDYVQAHISNISFPSDIEGLENYVYYHGQYNIEDVLSLIGGEWTVPRSSKVGDIVLWYHAKTAISRITALITQVNKLPSKSPHDRSLLLEWLSRAKALYNLYGGKIFAVGHILSAPELWDIPADDTYHFHGRVFAEIGDVSLFDVPVDISEFRDFICISKHSGITPLPSNEFHKLRTLISEKNNDLPPYFLNCEIGDYNLSQINKNNFLEIAQLYRRRFLFEAEFRSYYVDYILKAIAKRKVFRECICYTNGKVPCFVDNVFGYGDHFYLLEVKLNILLEKNLHRQLKQYVNADNLYLNKNDPASIKEFERRFMYVIDTNAFYRYDTLSDELHKLIALDDVHSIDNIKQFLPLP